MHMKWLVATCIAISTLLVGVASADTLGRLFSTPELRIELDDIRNAPDLGKPQAAVVVDVVSNRGPVVPTVTINGIVVRSSGQHSSWINGSRIPAGQATQEGIRVETSALGGGSVTIILPAGAETISLKPGQKIDLTTGRLLEAYEYRSNADAASAFKESVVDSFGDSSSDEDAELDQGDAFVPKSDQDDG